MPTPALNPLLPLIEDRLFSRLDPPRAARTIHEAVLAVSSPPVDIEAVAELRHALAIFSDVPTLATTIAESRRWLRLSLERVWRIDPSRFDLLLEIVRIDLSLDETECARHRLGRIARSRYRAADAARRLLAELPPEGGKARVDA